MSIEDDFGLERSNYRQEIRQLQTRIDRMEKSCTDAGLNSIALEVALTVEDLFAQHHDGGRTQRLARMQIIIREAMRANLTGSVDWKYPNNLKRVLPPQWPVGLVADVPMTTADRDR